MNKQSGLNKNDPIIRNAMKDEKDNELSPMDPPDAYAPPEMENIPYEDMHPFLQQLMDEHKAYIKELDAFEEVIISIQKHGITREADSKLRNFFQYVDEALVKHNQHEERHLFPLLAQRLIETGEHSKGPEKTTAVDMLESDHRQATQRLAIVFNFLVLAVRLPDEKSRLMVLDAAIEQGKAFVELMRLHIFREDNVVFVLAHKCIMADEFDVMHKAIKPSE